MTRLAARQQLAWAPTPHLHRLATVAAVALLGAALTARPLVLVIAAPLLCLLAGGRRAMLPNDVRIAVETDTDRCVEGESVGIRVRVQLDRPVEQLTIEAQVPPTAAALDGRHALTRTHVAAACLECSLRPARWGRVQLGVASIRVRHGGRLYAADAVTTLGELRVFPSPLAAGAAVVPTELLDRIGMHVGRAPGEGVQFAGVRPHVPGDRARRVNWRASARRGRLYVTTFAAERAADVVVALDAFSDVGPPGGGTLDRSLRGASALVQAYLRTADRVGVVALGRWPFWLAPAAGQRHLFRIAEALLDVRAEGLPVAPIVPRFPRAALPPRSLVVVFSPLLEEAALQAIGGLRERGHAVVVVDVLAEEPNVEAGDRVGALALRIWRLQRAGLIDDLAATGVPVVSWDGSGGLAPRLAPLAHRSLLGRI